MRESLLSRGGEFLIPKSEGLIGDNHVVGEIRRPALWQSSGGMTWQ